MESKSRVKQRLAQLFHASAATSSSSRRSICADMAVEAVFLSRNVGGADNPPSLRGKVPRSLPMPGSLDCGGCRPTRISSESDPVKKKKERRVRENGGLYETGGAEGMTCPPASPSSPNKKNHCFKENDTTTTTTKKKSVRSKKLLSNGYGFSSSSSDEGFELSREGDQRNVDAGESTETFFSSRSFSSDSSEFYSNSKKKKTEKKKKKKKEEEECGIAKSGITPVTKRSKDPYVGFRDSMAEMIVERRIFDAKGLEKLLHSFLSLNSSHHHPVILSAFADIFQVLFGDHYCSIE